MRSKYFFKRAQNKFFESDTTLGRPPHVLVSHSRNYILRLEILNSGRIEFTPLYGNSIIKKNNTVHYGK